MKERKSRKCFVLMPFDAKYEEVYEQVYRPVCEANDVDCWRVDEIARPGSITKDIIDGIVEADIIIADLTSRNANVFYELGIAHTIGNKTIMTAQNKSDVPFDIANYRVIFYEQSITGSKKLSHAIEASIQELLKSLEQTNNPVQEALSHRYVVGFKKRTPLVKDININALHGIVRNVFSGEKIVYTDELKNLDLEEMKKKYNLGKASFSTLVQIILELDMYDDIKKVHDLILKHKLNTHEISEWRRKEIFAKDKGYPKDSLTF